MDKSNIWRPWLGLNQTIGMDSRHTAMLMDTFGDIGAIERASPAALRAAGLSPEVIERIRHPDSGAIERDLGWLGSAPNRHLITYHDPRYPPLLRELAEPPLVLFVEGDPDLLSAPQLAIVGSRNPTPVGGEVAHDFAKYLSQAGLVITSGLALGIDAAGHTGALAGGGQTVAVMGTGPEQIYPYRHRALAARIVSHGGALVTECPTGTPPKPASFPLRNRIVAGLSLGTLVVEATPRSGSLITARLATEQGREVFAIPGSIHNPLARGCHHLLRQGAKLVETAADIIEELGPLARAGQLPVQQATSRASSNAGLDADYRKLLEYVGYAATPVDVLVMRSGFSVQAVSSMLLQLELQGYVCSMIGGYMRCGQVGD